MSTLTSIRKKILSICITFGIQAHDFFNVFKFELSELFDFDKENFELTKNQRSRIFDLLIVSNAVREYGYSELNSITSNVKIPTLDGESILDYFCKEKIDKERILFMCNRLVLLKMED